MDYFEKDKLGELCYAEFLDFYNDLKKIEVPDHMKKYDLDQIFPIIIYLRDKIGDTSYHKEINNYFREGESNKTARIKALSGYLDVALATLPSYNNKTVFRMVDNLRNLTSKEALKVKSVFRDSIGKSFEIKYYLSTSHKIWKFCEIIWEIKTLSTNSKAKDVEKISYKSLKEVARDEREVLFERGAKFEIISFKEFKNSHMIIQLNEIEAGKTDLDFGFIFE